MRPRKCAVAATAASFVICLKNNCVKLFLSLCPSGAFKLGAPEKEYFQASLEAIHKPTLSDACLQTTQTSQVMHIQGYAFEVTLPRQGSYSRVLPPTKGCHVYIRRSLHLRTRKKRGCHSLGDAHPTQNAFLQQLGYT